MIININRSSAVVNPSATPAISAGRVGAALLSLPPVFRFLHGYKHLYVCTSPPIFLLLFQPPSPTYHGVLALPPPLTVWPTHIRRRFATASTLRHLPVLDAANLYLPATFLRRPHLHRLPFGAVVHRHLRYCATLATRTRAFATSLYYSLRRGIPFCLHLGRTRGWCTDIMFSW